MRAKVEIADHRKKILKSIYKPHIPVHTEVLIYVRTRSSLYLSESSLSLSFYLATLICAAITRPPARLSCVFGLTHARARVYFPRAGKFVARPGLLFSLSLTFFLSALTDVRDYPVRLCTEGLKYLRASAPFLLFV